VTGRRTCTVTPPPSLGEAWTSPPCARATDRAIDSPSPAPRLVDEVVESARRSVAVRRREGSNRLGTSSGGTRGSDTGPHQVGGGLRAGARGRGRPAE